MTLPYLVVAFTLGPEFPSMFGGLAGLLIVISAARRGWFQPAGPIFEFQPREDWDPAWSGTITIDDKTDPARSIGMWLSWLPYGLVGLFLVLTRLRNLPFQGWLNAWSLEWPEILGSTITARVQPLFLPGTVFIVVSLLTVLMHRTPLPRYGTAWWDSLKTTVAASVALIFTVPMVQVFINSGGGAADYARMPIALADGVASLAGGAWPLFAPIIGGLGAFVAGSNTVSNMMFSLFQFGVGQRIGVDPSWVVALQAVGGAAGNMICVHNVVAASAVVGLVGREGAIIRLTFIPFLYYALLAGAVGYAIVWFPETGALNAGTLLAGVIALGILGFVHRQLRQPAGAEDP